MFQNNPQPFNFSKIREHSSLVIVGPSRSGKTTFLRKILSHLKYRATNALVISQDIHLLKDCIQNTKCLTKYDSNVVKSMTNEAKLKKQYNESLIIAVDVMLTRNDLNNEELYNLFINSRHYNIYFIITLHDISVLNAHYRCTVDYYFILQKNIQYYKKDKIYQYCFGHFPTFRDFEKSVKEYEDIPEICIIVDNTNVTTTIPFHYYYPSMNKLRVSFRRSKL